MKYYDNAQSLEDLGFQKRFPEANQSQASVFHKD